MKAAQVTVKDQHYASAQPSDPRRTALALAVAEVVPAGVDVLTSRHDETVSYRLPNGRWITDHLAFADQIALADQGPLLTSGESTEAVTVTVYVPEPHEVAPALEAVAA